MQRYPKAGHVLFRRCDEDVQAFREARQPQQIHGATAEHHVADLFVLERLQYGPERGVVHWGEYSGLRCRHGDAATSRRPCPNVHRVPGVEGEGSAATGWLTRESRA